MLNIGGGELLIIFLVALIVLGPTKLPDAAKQAGKIMGEFRRLSSGFQREMQSAMSDPVSAVTGQATPKSLKDVTTDAEVPPMVAPAEGVDTEDGVSSTQPESTPRPADPFESSKTTFSSASSASPTEPETEDAGVERSVDEDPPDDPVMYGDR